MKNLSLSEIASIWGRLGGLSRSPAKRAASRRNGLLGGRPRKVDTATSTKSLKVVKSTKRGSASPHSKKGQRHG